MTKDTDNQPSTKTDHSSPNKKSDVGQQFLRAARAGNYQKVLSLINQQNADINACNTNGLNALHLASKEGHVSIVRELLKRGAHPSTATKKGNTALHIASLAGQYDVVKLLLEANADVNVQAQNGFTPLYMAAQENHLEVVRLLLANHANPGLTTDDGFTPLAVALQQGHDCVVGLLLESDSRGKVYLPALHIASKKDDTKAANLLLNSDVNVDHQSASGFTPLHIAAHYGNINMVELLITRGANINFQAKNNITPLHVASKWGNLGVTERLIAAGAELDCRTRDGLTPLHCASRSGHDTVVQLLVNAGANLAAKTRSGLNALHMAAQGDHIDAARLLLQYGAQPDDVTIDYLTPLHVAAHYGNIRVAKLLLERGCDMNSRALNGFTPLHIACQKNQIKIVELLLKCNCLTEATTESGLTPLHVSCFMGHLNIVVLLLQHGANANSATVRAETSMHLATRASQIDVVRLLLRNGAQVDAKARGKQTALHIASRIGNKELVNLFLEHNADVHASTKDTYTPLHLAAKSNHTDVCELLIKAGAQFEVTTKSGFTPLHLATKHLHVAATEFLLKRGANVNAVGRNGLTPLHLATHYGSKQMVELLLHYKASPLAQAKNGFIPLHISAEKRLLEISKLLINAIGSDGGCAMQSRNGFTPLHLAAQSGSPEMTKLFLDSGAQLNALAKNGLTPMHLAAQEDSLKSAELLANARADLDRKTKAGYTPLHTACHFGQINVVRFLLGKGVDVNAVTCMGSNALHLAAQQGHSTVVFVLLESGADPNMRNKYNWTPAHVARHQHYLNIFEVLRQVTTCVESWDLENTDELPKLKDDDTMATSAAGRQSVYGNRLELEHPDMMRDNPITDTEEEFVEPDYTIVPSLPLFSHGQTKQNIRLNQSSEQTNNYRQHHKFALDKMSNVSGEDSIHEGTTGDMLHCKESLFVTSHANKDYSQMNSAGNLTGIPGLSEWDFTPDNVPISRRPIASGFLVSFLVDARGGSMRGSRHPGLCIMVPPSAASAPTRITCRMLRPERTSRPPQLNDSEGLACRIIELGPHPCRFNSPVLLEIPHFASLRGRQRELVVLRSDNAETWHEHSLEATDQAVQAALGQNFDGLETMEELREKRIIRILTNDFPQYLAVVSRLRQESSLVGSDGGVLSSSVIPQVQAVFPEGALQKRIRVGLHAQPISSELVSRLLGSRVGVSSIITLEPRRRKFHKPITLTIPLPKIHGRNTGQNLTKAQNVPNLRLLCSIKGGTTPAQWEDITGSTPLSRVKDCVSFTTTVSARFWLMDCQAVHESVDMASRLYAEASLVPYMGKFVVFTKRLDTDEALVRCFCVTDDKVDKTLECQEGFEVCAASPEVEVIESSPTWLEAGGNLLPVAKLNEQLRLHFVAFRENRLAFPVRLKDMQHEPVGKLVFMTEPRLAGNMRDTDVDMAAVPKPICTLEIRLGSQAPQIATLKSALDNLNTFATANQYDAEAKMGSLTCVFPLQRKARDELDVSDLDADTPKADWTSMYAADVIARSQLDLMHVASEIGSDWPKLVGVLVPESQLPSTCTVEQLVQWINGQEPIWQKNKSTENSGFGGPISVVQLRTPHDQALAVLIAWREEHGEAATGNELNRALRLIGREDVVKSCMRDIRYVVDAEEHIKATRQIDESYNNNNNNDSADLNSTSLVATDTLLHGMDENYAVQFDKNETLISSLPDNSDLIGSASIRRATDEVKPHNFEDSMIPHDGDVDDDEFDVQDQSEFWNEAGGGRGGMEPARSTSQYGGDLMIEAKNAVGTEEADLIRDNESVNSIMEVTHSPVEAITSADHSQLPRDDEVHSEIAAVPDVGSNEYGSAYDRYGDEDRSATSLQSDLIIQPDETTTTSNKSPSVLISDQCWDQEYETLPTNQSDDRADSTARLDEDSMFDAHHTGGVVEPDATATTFEPFNEPAGHVTPLDESDVFISHAHHGTEADTS